MKSVMLPLCELLWYINHFSKSHYIWWRHSMKKHGLFWRRKNGTARPTFGLFFCRSLHALSCPWKEQLATTPVSHHAGKALLEAVVKAALLSCYTQLFCAFFKPIYRPVAEAFLATRLPPLTGQCYSLVFVIKRVLGWKMPTILVTRFITNHDF